MKRMVPVLLAVLSLSANCGGPSDPKCALLAGAWKIVESRSVWDGGERVNTAPQPSLVIFTDRHYSISQVPGSSPRQPSVKTWFPTDQEKIQDFNTVIFNSGTYEKTDSILTIHPITAKTPEFMGGKAIYRIKILRDTLWMTATDIFSYDGIRDPGVDQVRTTLRMVRAE
jgi:hypothetical protein